MNKYKVAFHTLGCKTNHYETDVIARQFNLHGFEQVDFREPADAYIINTCTVTGEADRKSRQMLRRAKQNNPEAVVVAMGCHAELSDTADYADLCIGTQGKSRAVQLVKDALNAKAANAEKNGGIFQVDSYNYDKREGHHTYDDNPAYEELGISEIQSETRAYLKIEDGCNAFCSYCTIPLARGRVRSREPDAIMQEARTLVKAGYKEIVLTGIHLCSYGLERGEPSHSVALLAGELAGINGLERIRLGSLEPLSVTDEFLSVLSNNNKICPHFHLSLQSGCDKTLKAMNRRYNTEQYRQVVHKIRQIWPLAGITTDIIVGFPGETEADFQTSLEFCAEMELSRVHVFRFSPREGTRAADMSGQVSPAESAERSRKMQGLADQMSLAFNKKIFNSKLPFFVLLEKLREDDRLMTGYTDSYAPVLVAGLDAKSSNKLIQVKITGFDEHFLRGLPVKAD